jgi:transcriptional regulator with XRE-family HTH domain
MSIVTQLIALRKAQHLTQAALAERVAMTRMTVQRIESKDTDPRLSTVVELSKALGLELMLVPTGMRPAQDDLVTSQEVSLTPASPESQ